MCLTVIDSGSSRILGWELNEFNADYHTTGAYEGVYPESSLTLPAVAAIGGGGSSYAQSSLAAQAITVIIKAVI